MSLDSIQKALNARLETLSGIVTTDICWPAIVFDPKTRDRYWAPSVARASRQDTGLGPHGVITWNGTWQVSAMARSGTGLSEAQVMADAIKDHFGKTVDLTTTDSWLVRFYSAEPQPAIVEIPWVNVPVLIHFFVHEFPS